MMVRRKSQGESVKVTQFARPPSSHGDSPAGFTFMKAKLPQMDFSRKLIQTSVATAQGATQNPPVETPRNFSPSGGSSDAKVISSHFPLLTSTESSGTLDPPLPPANCQETVSGRENSVADPETSEVRDFPFLSDLIPLIEFSVIPQRHQRLRVHRNLSNWLPNHWKSLKRSPEIDRINRIASLERGRPISQELRRSFQNQ